MVCSLRFILYVSLYFVFSSLESSHPTVISFSSRGWFAANSEQNLSISGHLHIRITFGNSKNGMCNELSFEVW